MYRKAMLIVGMILLSTGAAQALVVYSLQAGAYDTEAEAAAKQAELTQRMSPVFVEVESGAKPYKVFVGHIPYRAEAWVFKSALKENDELPGCFIKKWDWDGRQLSPNDLPIEMPFDSDLVAAIPDDTDIRLDFESRGDAPPEAQTALEAVSLDNLSPEELYLRGDWGDSSTAVESLEYLLDNHPTSGYAHKARVRLAQRYSPLGRIVEARELVNDVLTRTGGEDYSRAKLTGAYLDCKGVEKDNRYEIYQSVVNDSGVRSPERLEAMYRAASCLIAKREYAKGWFAFLQLEGSTANPRVMAVSQLHKAAAAFELVSRGKSNWDEVRHLCSVVEEYGENIPRQTRATSRLMWAETYYHEKDYASAMTGMLSLRNDYPDVKREAITGLFWIGRCEISMGLYEDAINTFRSIQQEDLDGVVLFRSLNVKPQALLEEANILIRNDDVEAAQEKLNQLQTLYPSSSAALSLLED